MRKLLITSLLVGGLSGFELRFVADPNFCLRMQLDLMVCSFSNQFWNVVQYSKMKDAEKAKPDYSKAKVEKLEKKVKKELRATCYLWDKLSPVSKQFILNNVTFEEAPVAQEGEFEEICLNLEVL